MAAMDLGGTCASSLLIASLAACTVTTPLPAEPPSLQPAAPAATSIAADSAATPAVPSVPVELYVMSECPFCPGAVEAMAGALRLVGPHARFSLDYVGDVQSDGLASMHGDSEVAGDIAQICAAARVLGPLPRPRHLPESRTGADRQHLAHLRCARPECRSNRCGLASKGRKESVCWRPRLLGHAPGAFVAHRP